MSLPFLINQLIHKFEKNINQIVFVSATPGPYEKEKAKSHIVEQLIRPTGLLEPSIEIRPTKNQVKDLIREIKKGVLRTKEP